MGTWYRVIKTIKGHHYIYEQQTFREGGRVRTRNRYLGPAGEDRGIGSSSSGDNAPMAVTTTTIGKGVTSFGKAMLDQIGGIDVWGQEALAQLGMADAKAKRVRVVTTTRRRHTQKIFIGEKDGKKYYLIIEGTEDEQQTVPIGEVWLVPDE
jgi:hypothetical protein